jgi:DNA/RNA-binding protein KIN17
MPKAEKGTPKDIANKIKAKGLQKLKFYCQMCEKQCRDANGFKCHMTSETHLRNMKIFSDNASGIMDSNSREFERMYLDTLRRRHGVKRINANNVYQEVIQDRDHIHMNATKWATLAIFVQYLGRSGKCVVDETERGWYVAFIERDTEILERAETQKRRVEAEKVAEQRLATQMEIQRTEAAKALDRAGGTLYNEATMLKRDESDVKIAMALNGASKLTKDTARITLEANVFGDDNHDDDKIEEHQPPMIVPSPLKEEKQRKSGKRSNDEKNKEVRIEQKKQRRDHDDTRKEYWLRRDILVRIISKKLAGGKYFKRKAVVDRVLDDKFTAEVEVLDSEPDKRDGGDILRLDQDDLETVVPKEGKSVRIVNGPGRGKKAKVISLNPKQYKATLKVEDGNMLERVDYGDFSKLA